MPTSPMQRHAVRFFFRSPLIFAVLCFCAVGAFAQEPDYAWLEWGPTGPVARAVLKGDGVPSVTIDGKTVLETNDEQYAPNMARLMERRPPVRTIPPSVSAEHMELTLSHVVVERDVYYVSAIPVGSMPLGYKAWGVHGSPIMLRDGAHFAFGV